METVFCLIGFSGDDPNFLHWSGWVRDNLGKSAPKIYLAGWLDLSPHRRRMLEDRGVVPIDVARHPQAPSWPDHCGTGMLPSGSSIRWSGVDPTRSPNGLLRLIGPAPQSLTFYNRSKT